MYKRNQEGIHIINLGKTWEKLMVAARIIAAIPNPSDVLVSKGSFFQFSGCYLVRKSAKTFLHLVAFKSFSLITHLWMST